MIIIDLDQSNKKKTLGDTLSYNVFVFLISLQHLGMWKVKEILKRGGEGGRGGGGGRAWGWL